MTGLLALPAWFPHTLADAELFNGRLLPNAQRSLRILAGRQCELCGGGRVRGLHTVFPLFAHDKCVDGNLANEYYHRKRLPKARAAGTPNIPKTVFSRRGGGSFYTNFFWVKAHPLLPSVFTLEGVNAFRSPQAAAAAAAAYAAADKARAVEFRRHAVEIDAANAARARRASVLAERREGRAELRRAKEAAAAAAAAAP